MVAVCAAIPAMAEFKAEFNTAEATAINITEAGEYRVYNELFSQTNVPVVVNADIADTVFVTVEGANIVLAEDGSAMNIGANSVVVLNIKGINAFKGKNGCGIGAARERNLC